MPSAKANQTSQFTEKRLEVLPLNATEHPGVISLLVWAACVYLLILPIADVLIRLNWPAGAELSWIRGRFTAVNALTLTGFGQNPGLEKFPALAHWTIWLLTVIGAMFPMILGGMAVVRILKLPYSDKQIALSSLILFFVLVAAGSIPLLAFGYDMGNAFMLATSALANSGMHFGSLPRLLNWQMHLVLLPLAILGGLGSPVLIELFVVIRIKGRLSEYSKTVLTMTGWIYVALFLLIVSMQLVETESVTVKWRKILSSSSALAIDSRTAGFAIDGAQPPDLPRSAQWLLLLPMMLGGWAAGTAGGIKVNTFIGLFRGISQGLRGGSIGRPVAIAAVWIGTYFALTVVFFLMLLWSEPDLPADRLLFLTISALSNVGLSHDPVSIAGSGLDVLSCAMLLGRLTPIAMLWWMAMTTREGEMPVG